MTDEKVLDIVEKTINKLYEKIELLESKNQKLELDKTRLQHKLSLHDVGCSFLDELIEKHKANKKLALINCEKMKDSKDFPWYDATFNNELLFVFELEDLKIRLGL
tara:strand:+ start:263 stop:580 length:318 start_codon:yes stop_codon:yes gene_type:complete